jgi:hypothetical protein
MFKIRIYEEAKNLLKGAVETHIHLNPHVRSEDHMMDALEYANQARDAGMKAVVIKNVGIPSTGAAYFVNKIVNGFECYGSVAMNICNGGINPALIEHAVNHGDGARIVFFPVADSLNHAIAREKYYKGINPPTPREKALTIFDNNGNILPEVFEVLEIVKTHDRCINTAHLSPKEVKALIKEAKKIGIKKIIVSHGMWKIMGHTRNDLKEYADLGAFIEFEFYLCQAMMQYIHGHPPVNEVDMLETMYYIGIDHSIMSTDMGQSYSPNPIDGLRSFIASMLRCGAKPDEIKTMVQRNPSFLIGL